MNSLRTTLIRFIVVLKAAIVLALILPAAIAAQTGKNPPGRPSPNPSTSADRDMYLRQMNIRRLELEKQGGSSAKPAVPETVINQVKEDFQRIQEINAEIIRAYAAGEPPDYKHISEAMAEINKRAGRLNINLLLPPSQSLEATEKSREAGKKQARSPLLDLNDLINSFVTNPIFKNDHTIDAETGTKAKRDLESIIDLSNRISKSADKLSKTQSQSGQSRTP